MSEVGARRREKEKRKGHMDVGVGFISAPRVRARRLCVRRQ